MYTLPWINLKNSVKQRIHTIWYLLIAYKCVKKFYILIVNAYTYSQCIKVHEMTNFKLRGVNGSAVNGELNWRQVVHYILSVIIFSSARW